MFPNYFINKGTKLIKSWAWFLYVLILPSLDSYSQEFHSAKQYTGTEAKITKYLPSNRKQFTYVFFLPAMKCPRCEGQINPLYKTLVSKIDTSINDFIFIVNYPKVQVCLNYIKTHEFVLSPDTIENGDFSDNFLFSSGEPLVPFILKFNNKGSLLSQTSLLGVISQKKINQIIKANSPLKKTKKEPTPKLMIINDTLGVIKTTKLQETNDTLISEITYPFLSENLNSFSFSDDITLCIQKYNTTEGALQSVLCANDSLLLNVSPDLKNIEQLNGFKNMGLINPMYFKSTINDSCMVFSASLPYIFLMENSTKQNDWGSSNCAAIISTNKKHQIKIKTLDSLVTSVEENGFGLNHLNFHSFVFNNKPHYIFPVDKGIPVAGTQFTDSVYVGNPFNPTFYNNAPLFVVTNDSFKILGYLGSLDKFSRINGLGYSNTIPLVKYCNNALYTNTGYYDYLYVHNPSSFSVIDSIHLSPIYIQPDFYSKYTKPIVSKGQKMEYFAKFDTIIGSYLINFVFQKNQLITLYEFNPKGPYNNKKETNYYIQKYELRNSQYVLKEGEQKVLPKFHNDCRIKTTFFSEEGNLYGVYQNSTETYLVKFQL